MIYSQGKLAKIWCATLLVIGLHGMDSISWPSILLHSAICVSAKVFVSDEFKHLINKSGECDWPWRSARWSQAWRRPLYLIQHLILHCWLFLNPLLLSSCRIAKKELSRLAWSAGSGIFRAFCFSKTELRTGNISLPLEWEPLLITIGSASCSISV